MVINYLFTKKSRKVEKTYITVYLYILSFSYK